MKTLLFLGLGALVSLSAACTAETQAPSTGTQGGDVRKAPSQDPKQPSDSKPADPNAAPSTPANAVVGCAPLAWPSGVVNPASVYCSAQGYALDGEQCAFGDGTSCEQWAFYRGECGQAHSFCARQGGTVSNKTENMGTWTASYAVCTLRGHECQEDSFARSCVCQ